MSSYSFSNHATNNTIEVLNVKLKRHNNQVSWGFNIQGGREFSSPLVIQKVAPNSLAERCSLKPGDYILKIGYQSVENYTHNDARNAILNQGDDLELTVQRNSIPRHEDFSARYNFNNHQLMTPEVVEPANPKLSPQVGVALKDNRVLMSQSYNSPLGLYSKENIANTLVTTIKSLSISEPIDEKTVVDTLKNQPLPSSALPAAPYSAPSFTNNYPAANNKSFVPNFSNPTPPQPQYQQYQAPPPPPLPQPQHHFTPVQAPPPPPQPIAAPVPQYQPQPARNAPSAFVPPAAPRQPPTSYNPPSGPRNMNRGLKGSAIRKTDHPTIPNCSACGVVIRGPFISAVGKIWCPNHFTCASCGCNLEEVGFVEENGNLYCERDFEAYFAPKCAKCRRAIVGDCCYALQKSFHPDCFTCTHCNKKIGSGGFHVEDGLPYCIQDYNQLFSSKCAGCKFPIEAGDQFVEALNENWHVECFTCTTCHCKLEGIGFVVKSNKPYCKRHAR